MFRKKDAEVYYINERSRSASEELASLFSYCIQKDGRMFRELVFLCIGSDRITGDSLGPLIGFFPDDVYHAAQLMMVVP